MRCSVVLYPQTTWLVVRCKGANWQLGFYWAELTCGVCVVAVSCPFLRDPWTDECYVHAIEPGGLRYLFPALNAR